MFMWIKIPEIMEFTQKNKKIDCELHISEK